MAVRLDDAREELGTERLPEIRVGDIVKSDGDDDSYLVLHIPNGKEQACLASMYKVTSKIQSIEDFVSLAESNDYNAYFKLEPAEWFYMNKVVGHVDFDLEQQLQDYMELAFCKDSSQFEVGDVLFWPFVGGRDYVVVGVPNEEVNQYSLYGCNRGRNFESLLTGADIQRLQELSMMFNAVTVSPEDIHEFWRRGTIKESSKQQFKEDCEIYARDSIDNTFLYFKVVNPYDDEKCSYIRIDETFKVKADEKGFALEDSSGIVTILGWEQLMGVKARLDVPSLGESERDFHKYYDIAPDATARIVNVQQNEFVGIDISDWKVKDSTEVGDVLLGPLTVHCHHSHL